MGRLIGYILLSSIAGVLLVVIHPMLALVIGFAVVVGTLLYVGKEKFPPS